MNIVTEDAIKRQAVIEWLEAKERQLWSLECDAMQAHKNRLADTLEEQRDLIFEWLDEMQLGKVKLTPLEVERAATRMARWQRAVAGEL